MGISTGLDGLGLDGWGRPDNVSTGTIDLRNITGPDVTYFRLAYNTETGEACTYNATFIENILDQPLADNQFLVRFTVSCSSPTGDSFPTAELPDLFATGRGFSITVKAMPKDWDLCFEFNSSNRAKVITMTMRIVSENYATKPPLITAYNEAYLYAGRNQLEAIGAGSSASPYTNRNNLKTITNILPLALLYKSTGGGLYQLDPSNYAKRSELEALIKRVTALEEIEDG